MLLLFLFLGPLGALAATATWAGGSIVHGTGSAT